jgi:hypothetical protein
MVEIEAEVQGASTKVRGFGSPVGRSITRDGPLGSRAGSLARGRLRTRIARAGQEERRDGGDGESDPAEDGSTHT